MIRSSCRVAILAVLTVAVARCGLFDDTFRVAGTVQLTGVEGPVWLVVGDHVPAYCPIPFPDSLKVVARHVVLDVRQASRQAPDGTTIVYSLGCEGAMPVELVRVVAAF